MSIINYAKKEISFKIVYYGPGIVGQDGESPVHPPLAARRQSGQPDLAGHRRRAHPVLRLPAGVGAVRAELRGEVPALHGARAGVLQHDAQARAAGRRRHRVRRRLPVGPAAARTWRASRISRRTCASTTTISTRLPYVIQYNKRDLPNVAPVEYLEFLLNRRSRRVPYFEAVAVDGKGVFDTLNTVSRMVLVNGFAQEQGAPQ